MTSAAASAASSFTGLTNPDSSPMNIYGHTVVAGVVEGTASVLGGGKFSNGAVTSAFDHLVNAEGGSALDRQAINKRVGSYLKGFASTMNRDSNAMLYMNEDMLEDFMAYQYLQMKDRDISGAGDWAEYCRSEADSLFHFNGLSNKKIMFFNNSGNANYPRSGVFDGSDINYYAVGMALGMSNSDIVRISAVVGWNYKNALSEFYSKPPLPNWSAKWRHDASQMLTAQPWAAAGSKYYNRMK